MTEQQVQRAHEVDIRGRHAQILGYYSAVPLTDRHGLRDTTARAHVLVLLVVGYNDNFLENVCLL